MKALPPASARTDVIVRQQPSHAIQRAADLELLRRVAAADGEASHPLAGRDLRNCRDDVRLKRWLAGLFSFRRWLRAGDDHHGAEWRRTASISSLPTVRRS